MSKGLEQILVKAANDIHFIVEQPYSALLSHLEEYSKLSEGDGALSSAGKQELLTTMENDVSNITSMLNDFHSQISLHGRQTTYDLALRFLFHDINNSLTSILGKLQFLLEDSQSPEIKKRYIASINNSIHRIDNCFYIDSLCNTDLRILVTTLNSFYNEEDYRKKGIKVYYDTPNHQCNAYIIPSFTLRMFHNCLLNAVKARPKTDGTTKMYAITVRCYEEQNNVVVAIEDRGVGIDPEVIKEAAINAGYRNEQIPETPYDIISLIFNKGISGFKLIGRKGTGNGLLGANISKGTFFEDVAVETTIEKDGRLLTYDREHHSGHYDATKTTTGTCLRFYFRKA